MKVLTGSINDYLLEGGLPEFNRRFKRRSTSYARTTDMTNVVPATVKNKHFDATMAKLDESAFAGISIAITGCTTGIGREVAIAAAERGARTIFCLNRKSARSADVLEALRAKASPATTVHAIDCDLQSFDSVRAASAQLVAAAGEDGLHVLLLNAGVMACNEEASMDGYDVQMQTNVISHFLLVKNCMSALTKAASTRGEARIVSHSSGLRNRPDSILESKYFEKFQGPGSLGGNGNSLIWSWANANWVRYQQSKLANAVFAMALHDRLNAAGSKVYGTPTKPLSRRETGSCGPHAPHPRNCTQVKSLVAEPGLAASNLALSSLAAGGMRKSEAWLLKPFYQSAQDGALSAIWCCFAPDASSGDFYAPEKALSGKPVALARGGVFKDPKAERLSADVPSRALLWEALEKACGTFNL